MSADQRSEALGARNAGECRLAQDGPEKDDAVFGVEDCHGDQGEDEESGERAAEHFEEPGPLVYRELRRDICNIVFRRQGSKGSKRPDVDASYSGCPQTALKVSKTSFSGRLSLCFADNERHTSSVDEPSPDSSRGPEAIAT